ncbi:MAG: hypothetical protein GX790_02385, partial [Syntrophomonadaceae bacterium]|nr:hypothetical protein [Syntrophomonadaceae bacterium]
MQKRIVIMLLIVLSLSLVTIGCKENNDPSSVIAVVNGEEITQGQFDKYYGMIKTGYESQVGQKLDNKQDKELIEELKQTAFDDLVLQTIVKQDAKQKNIEVSSEQVEEYLESFKNRYSDADGYKTFLEKMGMTEEDLKEQIELENIFLLLKEEVTKDVVVTDEEAKEFYEENIHYFEEAAGMEISHILVETEKEADDILAKLEQGEDFSQLAKEFSTCPSSEDGGNLGLVNEETSFVEEFKTAALNLKSGEITETPVKTEFG